MDQGRADEEHRELHERLYRVGKWAQRQRSQSHDGTCRVSNPATAPSRKDSDLHHHLEICAAFCLMFYSLYMVVTLTPHSLASLLGTGAIMIAIVSALNMVYLGPMH